MRIITQDSSEQWMPESIRVAVDDLFLFRDGVVTLAPETPKDHRILLAFDELINVLTVDHSTVGRITIDRFAELPDILRVAVIGVIRIIVLLDTIHYEPGYWNGLAERISWALDEVEREVKQVRRGIRLWYKSTRREFSRRRKGQE